MADPVEAVRRLYAALRGGGEPTCTPGACAPSSTTGRKDAFGRHRYDPADFGWSYPELAAEFKEYTVRYRIPSELRG